MRVSAKAFSLLFPLFLFAATLAVYAPTFHAGFIWDDDDYVQENPVYTAANPLHLIWFTRDRTPQYYPMVFTSFYLERLAYGLNPLGYHLINILLHAGSATLLWLVLRRLKVPGAIFAAAVFALHPMLVESVAWVTERKNTFSTFFFLGALLAFLHWALPARDAAEAPDAAAPPASPAVRWSWYAASLFLFVLALLSKSVASGLAPVLVLILWWKRREWWPFLLTIPYFVLGAVAGWNTADLEKSHVGALGPEWQQSVVEKILLSGRIICFYAAKLLFPYHLNFYYYRWPLEPGVWWQWLFPVVVVFALVLLWVLRKHMGKAPLVGALAFVVLLFPALGFIPVFPMIFSWVADHFAYLSATAFIPLVCAVFALGARRLKVPQWGQVAVAAALLLALGIQSFSTSYNYLSMETLWSSILRNDPQHPHWNALAGMSGILHQKAEELKRQGHVTEANQFNELAKTNDEKVLEVKPGYSLGYYGLATYHLFRNETEAALPLILKAIDSDKTDARIYALLGVVYEEMHEHAKAEEAVRQAILRKPFKAAYHVRMAQLLRADNTPESDKRMQQYLANALFVDPANSDAHLLYGYLLAEKNEMQPALQEFETSMRNDPKNYEAMDGFARMTVLLPNPTHDQIQRALTTIEKAVNETGRTDAHYLDTFAMIMGKIGRFDIAITTLNDALNRHLPMDEGTRQAMQRHLDALILASTSQAPASEPRTPLHP